MIIKKIMEDILKNPLARHSAKIQSYQFIGDDFHQKQIIGGHQPKPEKMKALIS